MQGHQVSPIWLTISSKIHKNLIKIISVTAELYSLPNIIPVLKTSELWNTYIRKEEEYLISVSTHWLIRDEVILQAYFSN